MKKSTAQSPATPETQSTQPTTALVPVADYGADMGAGFEHQSPADVSLPWLAVLQDNSPIVRSLEAAQPGLLHNSVTDDCLPAVDIVPATTRHLYVEWLPKAKGGGFLGVHEPTSPVVVKARASSPQFGQYTTPEGNELVETFYVYAVQLDASSEPTGPVVIACTKTKIGQYKRWMTRVSMFQVKTPSGQRVRPPLYAHLVRVTTFEDKNPKGTFYNIKFDPAKGDMSKSLLEPTSSAYLAARELRDLVSTNRVSSVPAAAEETAPTDPDWNPQ
jgi:hypothetical protein